jgi:acetyl-CoA hydrolase
MNLHFTSLIEREQEHLFIAHKVIIELSTATPSFEGLHDITMTGLPPRRKPYLIMAPEGETA